MNPHLIAPLVFACVFATALLGMRLRAALPDHHLGTDTKDAVRIGMGLVATMAALILGLLVASAKGSYDTEKSEVTQKWRRRSPFSTECSSITGRKPSPPGTCSARPWKLRC